MGNGSPGSCTEANFDTALANVQSNRGGTITFDCGGEATITFIGGKIITNASAIIDGEDNITLSGANVIRPFYVDSNVTLTLQNITLQKGFDNTYGGGSILNLGTLTLENATILSSNVDLSHSGGAIYNTIIDNSWVTQLSHAAYLGKELVKAELSLQYGFKYSQDGA